MGMTIPEEYGGQGLTYMDAVLVIEEMAKVCGVTGLPNLSGDERFRTNAARLMHRAELIEILSCRILNFKKSELVEGMEQRGIPGGEINTVEEAFNTSQVEARGMKIAMKHPLAGSGEVNLIGNPLKFSATPVTYRYAPPLCGQHTEEILNDFLGEG